MSPLKSAALATLQLSAAVSNLSLLGNTPSESNLRASTQTEVNQLSLAAMKETWLKVPRLCKAAAFNAQPVSLEVEARSEALNAIYKNFAV